MRRSASEVIRNLEMRIARLENKTSERLSNKIVRNVNQALRKYDAQILDHSDLSWLQAENGYSLYRVKNQVRELYVILRRQEVYSVYTDYDEAIKTLEWELGEAY